MVRSLASLEPSRLICDGSHIGTTAELIALSLAGRYAGTEQAGLHRVERRDRGRR